MSLDSDIRDIKKSLTDNKNTLTALQKDLQAMKADLKKIQDSGSNDFFRVVKGAALVRAMDKISSIDDNLKKMEKLINQ